MDQRGCAWKVESYGIEDVDEIQVPNDPKNDGKIKGFAFLRFNTCSDANAAFHRLRKPDAVFGKAKGAKVAFAHTPMRPREEVRLQVKTVYVEGIPKSWDVQKLKEISEQYGETKKVKISRNFGNKGKDFGFISFTTRESAVACVGGMNKLQSGGNVKVKADIARPLVGGHLQKSSCGGLKLDKRHRSIGWSKMKGHARFEGAEKESDMKAQTVLYKSKIRGTEVKAASVAHKNNQAPLNSKRTIEGETNEPQSIASEAHDAGAGLSTSLKKLMTRERIERDEGAVCIVRGHQRNWKVVHKVDLVILQEIQRADLT